MLRMFNRVSVSDRVIGFPRKMDQAIKFEDSVCPSKFTLFFKCSEEEMKRRLLKRGETSGRTDDNEESIVKRFRTFENDSMPVVNYFEKEDKVVEVDATAKKPDDVYADVVRLLSKRGFEKHS